MGSSCRLLSVDFCQGLFVDGQDAIDKAIDCLWEYVWKSGGVKRGKMLLSHVSLHVRFAG